MQLGISLSFIGVVVAFAQGYLTRKIIPFFGERRSVSVGLFFYLLCFFLFSVASREWMLYAVIVLFGMTGIATPSLQALMTKKIGAREQGELQGSLVSLESLAAVIAPFLFTPLFLWFTREGESPYFPGIVFLGASLISLVAFALWCTLSSKFIERSVAGE
jgi:DHA1 family tetracycline resistance protein-like MFS transporter